MKKLLVLWASTPWDMTLKNRAWWLKARMYSNRVKPTRLSHSALFTLPTKQKNDNH